MITNACSDVRNGRLDSVMPMIAKKARSTYYKLPSSEKMGRSVKDLIADGRAVAVTRAAKMYKPGSNVKFSTYLFVALDNYYKDILKAAYTNQRCGNCFSYDSTIVSTRSGKTLFLSDFVKKSRRDLIEDKLISRIDAERGFLRAYAAASPLMRQYLIRWLLQPKNNKFKEQQNGQSTIDFRSAAIPYLNSSLCRTILTDYQCRSDIANAVMSKFVTPRRGHTVAYSLEGTVERDLLPLLSPSRQKAVLALL